MTTGGDGATVRQRRMKDLANFLDKNGNQESIHIGVHMTGVQAHMTLQWGMKRVTTREMVGDLERAGILHVTQEGMVKLIRLPSEWNED